MCVDTSPHNTADDTPALVLHTSVDCAGTGWRSAYEAPARSSGANHHWHGVHESQRIEDIRFHEIRFVLTVNGRLILFFNLATVQVFFQGFQVMGETYAARFIINITALRWTLAGGIYTFMKIYFTSLNW